jgi:small GTP-binding protein
LSTIGAKVDTKLIALSPELSLRLVIWDLAGAEELSPLTRDYLRGASGYLLVSDGTKHETWERALNLQHNAARSLGEAVPFVLAVNKSDLRTSWHVTPEEIASKRALGWKILETSARTDENVEELFLTLARALVSEPIGSKPLLQASGE